MKVIVASTVSLIVALILPFQATSQQATALEHTPADEWVSELTPAAVNLSKAIVAHHISGLAVIGPADQQGKITELGLELGNALSNALEQQAHGFRVLPRQALLEKLKSENMGAGNMFSSPAIVFWLGPAMQLDGYVLTAVSVSGGNATLTIELHSISQDEKDRLYAERVKLPLTADQKEVAKRRLNSDLSPSGKTADLQEPECVQCPRPAFPGRLQAGERGELYLLVTVTREGKATEVILLRGVHNKMDEISVQTVQSWRFRPAHDDKGSPVERRVIVEVQYEEF